MKEGHLNDALLSGVITIILGCRFTALQVFEYFECGFTIADGTYGNIFFILTGFHGAHIIVGILFIIVILSRVTKLQFSNSRATGFDLRA